MHVRGSLHSAPEVQEETVTWELLAVIVVVGAVAGLAFAYWRSRKPGGR
jgi:hypothetical protein